MFRGQFQSFYHDVKIKLVTDSQVREGKESLGIDEKVRDQLIPAHVKKSYKNIGEDDPEVAMNTNDGSMVQSYLAGTVLQQRAEDLLVNEPTEQVHKEVDAKIKKLEEREAEIISDLYTLHFKPKEEVAKDKLREYQDIDAENQE